jgi:hypothetical protein
MIQANRIIMRVDGDQYLNCRLLLLHLSYPGDVRYDSY